MTADVGILLCNPKTPYNVGGVIRNMAEFQMGTKLRWTGERVHDQGDHKRIRNASAKRVAKHRFPREERITSYGHIDWQRSRTDQPLLEFVVQGFVPVCVEVLDNSESLIDFEHPPRAVYVFGPEDGGVPKGIRHTCHRFVTIPTHQCLNLAVTTGIVMYDRLVKQTASGERQAARPGVQEVAPS